MNSAKTLLQFNFDATRFAARAPRTPTISKEQLATLEKIIKTYSGTDTDLPNKESLRQVYHQFLTTPTRKLSSEFDSIRRTRQLAWTLTYAENGLPRIVDTPKLQNALQLIENRFRTSMLPGIFNALLQAWDTPNTTSLRAFLKKQLTSYTGSRKFVQKLKTNMAWYCEKNSATQLATYLLRSRKKLSEVWAYLELPDYMHSYSYFGAVATAYAAFAALNNQFDQDTVTDVVNFIRKHNNDKTSRTVLSKLIEKLGIEATETLRQSVQSYVLQEWQDPRIAGADVRWRDVSDKARQIFTKWITEEDLRFFFDVVARACGDPKFEYRKTFWLSYLEHISFCRPVLRKNSEYLFRHDSQALQYYRDRRPATLTGGNRDQHAFIIQMGNYTFVEFSTAAACYAYHNADIPFEVGNSEYRMDELRLQSWAEHRVIHNNSERYSWQSKFASWLEYEVGIKPLRSYRFGESSNHSIVRCPNRNCMQRLRITEEKGPIRITCPKCNTVFRHEVR